LNTVQSLQVGRMQLSRKDVVTGTVQSFSDRFGALALGVLSRRVSVQAVIMVGDLVVMDCHARLSRLAGVGGPGRWAEWGWMRWWWAS
jgi:hypothetical protein